MELVKKRLAEAGLCRKGAAALSIFTLIWYNTTNGGSTGPEALSGKHRDF